MRKKKANLNLCNKMQNKENSQILKSDLKEKTLRIISEVQKCNTNNIIEESLSSISEPENDSESNVDIMHPAHYKKDTGSLENKMNNILFAKVVRLVLCIGILFMYIYNLLSIHNEPQSKW